MESVNPQGTAVSIGSQSAPGQPDAGGRRSPQLLVVDDDATQCMPISAAAKHAGHAVALAHPCAEAMKQIRTTQFDCVALDLILEDGDGLEVLQAMAGAKFAGSAIVISGMNASRRTAARSHARSPGIEFRNLPTPVGPIAIGASGAAERTSRAAGAFSRLVRFLS